MELAPRDGLDRASQSTAVNDDLPESLTADQVTVRYMLPDERPLRPWSTIFHFL